MGEARGYNIRVANVALSATDAEKIDVLGGNIIMNGHLWLMCRLKYQYNSHCLSVFLSTLVNEHTQP